MIIESNSKNRRLIGAVVGSGIVARAAEEGGADFLLALSAGKIRSMGAPSIACMLPIHDALNATIDFAVSEILPLTKLPVLLGINCWHPDAFKDDFAARIVDAGFSGAVNFPPAMYFSDSFNHVLEQSGHGMKRELEVLQRIKAHGGKAIFYCSTRNQARMGVDAGIDGLVLNFGWNKGGAFGHRALKSLEEVALLAADVSKYVKWRQPDLDIFLEGGPILSEADLHFVAKKSNIDGYVGGSTLDRVPIETAIADQIAKYRISIQPHFELRDEDKPIAQTAKRVGLEGKSSSFVLALRQIARIVNSHNHVMLSVPPGGPLKNILQLYEQLMSKRKRGQFIELSHETLSMAELNEILFSHKDKGDIPGILGNKDDTIIIHDFHVLPGNFQKRLSRALQTGYYTRIGDIIRKQVCARIILVCRTPELLGDLQHYPDVTLLTYPPLNNRREDLPDLLESALERFGVSEEKRAQLNVAMIQKICSLDWQGNESAFHEFLRRLADTMDTQELNPDVLETIISNRAQPGYSPLDGIGQREQILKALASHGYRRTETAYALGISRKTLYNRMKKFQLC